MFCVRGIIKMDTTAVLLQKTITLLYKGGFWLAAAQLFKIILKIWLMTAVLERWPFPEFADTTQFIGGIVRTVLTVFLAGYCYQYLSKNPFSKQHWITAGIVALPMIISGAWLVHGAGRFENQFILMSLTVIHQLAAAAWIGGIFQLVNLWFLRHSKQVPAELWPLLLKRFTIFGIASVAMILISGLPIALQYIDYLERSDRYRLRQFIDGKNYLNVHCFGFCLVKQMRRIGIRDFRQ